VVRRHLLRDEAYEALSDAIVSGQLRPGEQLHDAELCAWLNLSRSPVRAALARLEDEGLIETAPQRSTRVTTLESSRVLDGFPVLAALHALATELAVPRLAREELERLRAENRALIGAVAAGNGGAAYTADERFHAVLVGAAGNQELSRALARLAPGLRRLARVGGLAAPGRRSVAQHEAIIERAAAGDAARAAAATRENWLELGAVARRALAGA